MSLAVVEVGPVTIRGPEPVPPEWVSAAIACVDDPLALLDDQPVEVPRLWRDVLAAAAGPAVGELALVVPTWWPSGRIAVVADAARQLCTDTVVLQRGSLLDDDSDEYRTTFVELSTAYVLVTEPGADYRLYTRDDPGMPACLETASAVLVDIPAGVAPLPPLVLARLRSLGIAVEHTTGHRVRSAALSSLPEGTHRIKLGRRGLAVLSGVALTVVTAAAGWAAQANSGQARDDTATRVLVDGGVAVRVPAHWTAERITAGPGSARVRIFAPGGTPALHVTQSPGASATSIADVAASLQRALQAEPAGVFVDFEPAAEREGRPAVTYVERRAGSETRWTVVVDGALRIAIGCQSGAPEQADIDADIDDACATAVRSAQAVQ